MSETITGLILKGISGFYSVEAADTLLECRARGLFRKEGITPLAGDRVKVVREGSSATITEILPRKNALIRPPVANLDVLVLVVSLAEPAPNLPIMDRMIAVAEYKEIEPVLVLNKTDLADPAPLEELYHKAGFSVYPVLRPEWRKSRTHKRGPVRQNGGVYRQLRRRKIQPAQPPCS